MHEGKPLKQSLAIAYNMKRKAKKAHGGEMYCADGCEMLHKHNYADGGNVSDDSFGNEPEPSPSSSPAPSPKPSQNQAVIDSMNKAFGKPKKAPAVAADEEGYAAGGFVKEEKESGYRAMPNPPDVYDPEAIELSERKLNQHGELERGPEGREDGMDPGERLVNHMIPNQSHAGDDMVGHIMKKRQMKFSHGGDVSSYEGEEEFHDKSEEDASESERGREAKFVLPDERKALDMVGHIMKKRAHKMSRGGQVANDVGMGASADLEDNQFDDLVKRDDLESSYTGANSGDEIGDAREDADRRDIVAMIMKSRKKKDRLPRPA